jgi:tyrosine-protein phosphatase YwqE
MLQLNFGRLIGKGSFFRPNEWRKLLRDGYVDFLGSDTHGMKFRPLHVAEAIDWLYECVEPELRKRIMTQNIKLLIGTDKEK